MVADPKTLPSRASVTDARDAFADEHVHLLLLVEGRELVGTLTRDDLAGEHPPQLSALDLATLEGRVIAPDVPLDEAGARMRDTGRRRLAVVDGDGRLLGLLCLKRHGRGFCTAEDLASRRSSQA